MAKKDKKKLSKIKVKKKIWFKIIAPKIFGNKEVGESYLTEAKSAIGRVMKISLKDLTGNVKDQNSKIGLQINKLDGSLLNTSVISYELTPMYVKRLVRKNTARIDDFFRLKTKDGQKVIIKSLMITLNKTQRSTRTQLSKDLKGIFEKELSKSDFATFLNNLVNHKIQIIAKKQLNKVFPLKDISVRVLKLDEKGLVGTETVVEESVPEMEEKITEAEEENLESA